MIDAANITKYNLSQAELEARIVFWILAAGKNGTRAAKIANAMVEEASAVNETLFDYLHLLDFGDTVNMCKYYKTGCFGAKARSIYEICRADLNLRTCTTEDLEKIYGIGMKTARCFIIHTRENASCAGLDTHMLKYLRSLGYDVPKNTPSSKKLYLTLEKIVLNLADKAGESPAKFDLNIWNKYKVV
jgi:thermostable 8-oxoguanine DNA glycosylase